MTVELRNDESIGRYELVVDGSVVSYADYRLQDQVMVLPHTVTDPAARGHGHAATLVRLVLDEVRAAGRTVVPTCWYVAKFIDEHPDYADLLEPS